MRLDKAISVTISKYLFYKSTTTFCEKVTGNLIVSER
jgi:hypothetical protein